MRGVIGSFLVVFYGLCVSAAAEPVVLSVAEDGPVGEEILGFGAEWDGNGYAHYGLTSEEHALEAARIRWMRPGIMRVMVLTRWLYDNGEYTWDSPGMTQLYRSLDLLQELGVTVFLTDWGGDKEWTRGPGIEGVDDPTYAAVVGTYLERLVKEKGYTCIKYFICTNEPNWEVGDWARWKAGLLNIRGEMAKRGLLEQVGLAGSDTSQMADNDPWHRLAVDELQDVLSAYDVHHYVQPAWLDSGQLEQHWRAHHDYAVAHDPKAASKPFLVGEAGIWTESGEHSISDRVQDYDYGVLMADYAAQAIRGGWTGVSAWMLSDNSHVNFRWGLWGNKEAGMELRPWFYTWSLLCRYVRPGMATYGVAAPEGIRAFAARKAGDWTVVVINRGAEAQALSLELPEDWQATARLYRYSAGDSPVDGQGFPVPVANWTRGDKAVSCPGNAVLVFTSCSP